MASETVIQAENVSKQFVLSGHRASDLRERLGGLFKRRGETPPAEPFYALRDIRFTVARGETVGIVGHNGSGKSTLLKMLTGILKSDTGFVRTHGRIGALIEVGAGFHPDLSGRENVFLNGSIMGLSRAELAKKFDAIVEFAGLEKFIDTPVKRYSSGMFMRLGFAIATHIDPEILLIDEVLAVGDTQFQNKCLNHLRDFSASGGTVVFVSHTMAQVAALCERCLWLDRGRLLYDGATVTAVDSYMALVAEREDEELLKTHPEEWTRRRDAKAAETKHPCVIEDALLLEERQAQEMATRQLQRLSDPNRGRITGCLITDADGVYGRRVLRGGATMIIQIGYEIPKRLPDVVLCVQVFREDGLLMFAANTAMHDLPIDTSAPVGTVRIETNTAALNTGNYRVTVSLYRSWKGNSTPTTDPYDDRQEVATDLRVNAGRYGGYGAVYMPLSVSINASVPPMQGDKRD